jgi:hypothetical protein
LDVLAGGWGTSYFGPLRTSTIGADTCAPTASFAGSRRHLSSRSAPLAHDRSPIAGFPNSISAFRLGSSALTRPAPNLADRVGLPLHVGEEGGVVGALQPLPDQGPEDNLQAHGEPKRHGRLSRQDPGPIQKVAGENEKDSGLVREHHPSRSVSSRLPVRQTVGARIHFHIIYCCYIIYYVLYSLSRET